MGRIITVSREYGSMGHPIAEKLADRLGYDYYDHDLLTLAANKMNEDAEKLEAYDDKKVIHTNSKGAQYVGMAFPFGLSDHYKSMELFRVQEELIKEIAASGKDVLIVGRCADYILTKEGYTDIVRFHITSSYTTRCKNATEFLGFPEIDVKERIRTIDKARDKFYQEVTGVDINCPKYRDFQINTDFCTQDECVDYMCGLIDLRFRHLQARKETG